MELYVIFYADCVKVFDLRTKDYLTQIDLIDDFDKVEENIHTSYSFFLLKDTEQVYEVKFSLLSQVQKVQTKAGYILNIGTYFKESRGFYVGLYEFGTFLVKNDDLIIENSIPSDSVSYGILNEQNNQFIVCRSTKGIECWNWTNLNPELLWSKADLLVSKGLVNAPNGTYLVGTKEGTIYQLNEKGEEIHKLTFEQEPIRHMIWTDACICVTNRNSIYKFSLGPEYNLIWKTKLDFSSPNHSLAFINNQIWITTYLGELIVIDNESGKILTNYSITKENFSPVAVLLNKWLIYTSPEILHSKLLQGNEEKDSGFTIVFPDKMIRSLVLVKDGVIVGDDYGDLSLLKRPQIDLIKMNNLQKLMEFNPNPKN